METEDEIWKDVGGYEDYYQVSNIGRVRSVDRVIDSGQCWLCKRNGKILKTTLTGVYRNYPSIQLQKDGEKKNHKIHRLVAAAFIPNPENKPEVNHINGNTKDNRVGNLEWCTPKENVNHAFENGLYPERRGKESPNTRWVYHVYLNDEHVTDLCGTTSIEEFGLMPVKVAMCCRGLRKKHKGYTFTRTRYEK